MTLTQTPSPRPACRGAFSGRRAGALASRVPAERRDAVAKELQAGAKKYVDEAMPIVRERAIRLAPGTIGTLMEQTFTDDELRQIIAVLESPVWTRYQQLGGEMQAALVEKLVADARPAIDPKVKALEQSMARRLGLDTSGVKPAKKPASRRASAGQSAVCRMLRTARGMRSAITTPRLHLFL